jgi:hypothetical protein
MIFFWVFFINIDENLLKMMKVKREEDEETEKRINCR